MYCKFAVAQALPFLPLLPICDLSLPPRLPFYPAKAAHREQSSISSLGRDHHPRRLAKLVSLILTPSPPLWSFGVGSLGRIIY